MTRSKKRNLRRKRQNPQNRSQQDHVLNTEQGKKEAIEAPKKYPDQPRRVAPLQKKKILGLIEKAANKLKLENSLKLVALLETVFIVFSTDAKKRPAMLELIDNLLSKVKEYDQSEIKALKNQLNSVFLPKELKELVVDASDLTESVNVLSLLFGPCEFESYLNRGRPVRVFIKESDENGDDDNFKIVREARILSQLRHENIIKILAFERTGPRIALEYMKLGSLSVALMKFDFSTEKLFNIVKEVTAGMMYLAERHYILRNLNTDNVLLDSRGKCKIGNFAYCEYVGDSNEVYVDEDTDLNLDFAAPEVRNAKEFSTKSDVWDLGLLAWQVYHAEPNQTFYSSLTSRLRTWGLLQVFIESGRLLKPERFPISQWQSFRELLHQDPNARPTFFEIMRILREN